MVLFFGHRQFDSSVEQEFKSTGIGADKFGFKAYVNYMDGSYEVLRNLTEVHHRYESAMVNSFGHQIAFESDYHSTGKTVRLTEISSVLVECDKSHHDEYNEVYRR